jgi:hypothetical protein
LQEELERQRALEEARREANESKLQSEKYELADQLREVSASLKQQEEGWTKERGKTLKLTFSTQEKYHGYDHIILSLLL